MPDPTSAAPTDSVALQGIESQYRALFDSMDEGFCIIEMLFDARNGPPDYRFLEINPAFERQTGLVQAVGKTARELIPNQEAFWFDTYGRVATSGESTRFEHQSAALERYYQVHAFRVGTPEQHRVAILFNDVSARRQAEVALQALNATLEQRVEERTRELAEERAALQQANEELDAFNYSVSHDLMTPVRHVAGFAALAGRHLDNPEKARRYLNIVQDGATRMATLIQALLTLSRTGKLALNVGVVDLGALSQQACLDAMTSAGERHVEWRIKTLPLVQGDRATLQQVLTNLFENAVKYSRERDPAVIEVWAEEDERFWTVSVRDNGAGFDMKYANKLFGIFQRLHRQDEFEGTGVGLSLVRRIITRHGGTVSATGEVGQGATLSFTLPKPRE